MVRGRELKWGGESLRNRFFILFHLIVQINLRSKENLFKINLPEGQSVNFVKNEVGVQALTELWL